MKSRITFLLVLALVLVFSVTAYAGPGEVVDGYIWQDLNRDVKTGVVLGSAETTNWFGQFLGESGGVDMNFDTARTITYFIDDLYEDHAPLYYSVVDVIMKSGELGL